jgi:methyl-accepting chemotaxis protein
MWIFRWHKSEMRILKARRWLDFGLVQAPLCALWWMALVNGQDGTRQWTVVGGVVAVILTLLASWFMANRADGTISAPIAAAKQIVAGNLTAKIEVDGTGELRELMEAMNALNERMFKLIGDVRVRSTTVVSTSSQVSRDSETLRVRTEMQIASLQKTTEAMTRLNEIVQQNAEQTKQADELVASASTHAVDGGKAMGQAVTTMGSIRDSSRKIVDIIALIDSIAFQTNILALNAAVEAARAGEHGRGFAVVASEVGTLAKRSATAAKEIKSLINESVKTISTGSKLVDQAGATMSSIVSSVSSLTGIIQRISSASIEQRSGIESVNGQIGELTRLNKSNTHMFADIIKASGTLNEHAVTLLKSIAGFNLGIREHGTPEEAHAMVKRAVEYLKQHGKDQFLAEVNKTDKGQFIERDLYVIAIDMSSGKYVGHGVNTRVLKYDARLSKDSNGRSYMTEMIDQAKHNGEGWIEYTNNHPVTNELLSKSSFFQRVGDLVVASGAYKV